LSARLFSVDHCLSAPLFSVDHCFICSSFFC
jgi:hypothetical protein